MPPAPTPKQIQSLYTATITAAQGFSYNFQRYFIRRADLAFKPVLASLNPPAGSTESPNPNMLAHFFETQQAELEVLKRASQVNKMFEGPKLVVEHAQPITSGGGAGMEASAGGGGQPI